jgi:hypothetical protein
MIERITRVFRLDTPVFREIAVDSNATGEAAIIVVIVSLLSGIGAGITGHFFSSLISQLILGVVFWALWAVVTYFIGTLVFAGKTTIEEMLRVLGYANAPRLLGFFNFIPCVGPILSLIGAVLSLIAGILAIREAMEFDTGKAVITAVIGWVIFLILGLLVLPIFGLGFLVFG